MVQFKSLVFDLGQVGDLSDEGAYHILSRKLPEGMWQWVQEDEISDERKYPLFEVTFPCSLNEGSVRGTIERNTGGHLRFVESVSSTRWRVVFDEKCHAEKLLSLSGLKVAGGGSIFVRQHEKRFSLDEALTLITDRIETAERKTLRKPPSNKSTEKTLGKVPRNRRAETHMVLADDSFQGSHPQSFEAPVPLAQGRGVLPPLARSTMVRVVPGAAQHSFFQIKEAEARPCKARFSKAREKEKGNNVILGMLVGTGAGVVLPGTLRILPHLMLTGARAAVSEYVAGPEARAAWVGIQGTQTLPSVFKVGVK